jgi:NitT/TauT family transport system substrate-binding protein
VRGPRLSLMASQVADAFGTKERINPDRIFDASYLPTKDARAGVLGK